MKSPLTSSRALFVTPACGQQPDRSEWSGRHLKKSSLSSFAMTHINGITTMTLSSAAARVVQLLLPLVVTVHTVTCFTVFNTWNCRPAFVAHKHHHHHHVTLTLAAAASDSDAPTLQSISEEQQGVPIPFVDIDGQNFIECYADSFTTIDGTEYTIGVPCDYAVALCYFDEAEQLIPVELDDEMMDDVFPIAEGIVDEEFGEELSLHRTPQTLTLVGELEDEEEEEEDDDDDDMEEGEEEVEVLLSFEHRGKEFNLVRLLDPVLLVGKADPDNEQRRILLALEESEQVMPILENMFLEFHADADLEL